ncbi:hypothetical protein LXL04_023844 [Taraxacum kok-saghyz]
MAAIQDLNDVFNFSGLKNTFQKALTVLPAEAPYNRKSELATLKKSPGFAPPGSLGEKGEKKIKKKKMLSLSLKRLRRPTWNTFYLTQRLFLHNSGFPGPRSFKMRPLLIM